MNKAATRRDEIIRQKLNSDGRKSALWTFINSSFGIFLLSSVMVSGISYFYSSYQNDRKERLEKQNRMRRLDTELSYRVYYALHWVQKECWYSAGHVAHGDTGTTTLDYTYLFAYHFLDNYYGDVLNKSSYIIDVSTYPDFKNRPFVSLLNELYSEGGDSILNDVRSAYVGYNALIDSQVMNQWSRGDFKAYNKKAIDNAWILQTLIYRKRWQRNFW